MHLYSLFNGHRISFNATSAVSSWFPLISVPIYYKSTKSVGQRSEENVSECKNMSNQPEQKQHLVKDGSVWQLEQKGPHRPTSGESLHLPPGLPGFPIHRIF